MRTKTLLRKAKALVQAGWCQGTSHRTVFGRHCYCATGAVDAVPGADWRCVTKARHALTKAAGTHILLYNDDRGRTKAEVLAVFTRTIRNV